MKNFGLVILLILTISSFGLAQTQTQTDDYNRFEAFVGYSSNSTIDDEDSSVIARGFNVSGVYNIKRRIGIKIDASQSFGKTYNTSYIPYWDNPTGAGISYSSRDSISNYVAGVQFKNNSTERRFKPFAHVMAGVGQYKLRVKNISCTTPSNCALIPVNETDTGFALTLGGGLDIKVNRRIDIRVVQLDLHSLSFERSISSREAVNTFRFGAGIVFK